MTCTRQPGTIWPACKCPNCRAEMCRLSKRHRNGIKPLDQRAAAWTQIQRWHTDGLTTGLVSTMTGIGERCLTDLWKAIDEDRRPRMYHRTAAAVLAAAKAQPEHGGLMAATGTRRRLQALAAIGWSIEELRDRYDLTDAISKVRSGVVTRTHPHIVTTVARAYTELWNKPGPSNLTAKRAARQGWVPPIAWDDDLIDAADAEPVVLQQTQRTGGGRPIDELVEDIEWLLGHDPLITSAELAERLGYADRSAIQNALRADRGNRPDLLERLARNAEVAA